MPNANAAETSGRIRIPPTAIASVDQLHSHRTSEGHSTADLLGITQIASAEGLIFLSCYNRRANGYDLLPTHPCHSGCILLLSSPPDVYLTYIYRIPDVYLTYSHIRQI